MTIIILCILLFCMCAPCVCSAEEDIASPGVSDSCELLCGCWELNPGPLVEQPPSWLLGLSFCLPVETLTLRSIFFLDPVLRQSQHPQHPKNAGHTHLCKVLWAKLLSQRRSVARGSRCKVRVTAKLGSLCLSLPRNAGATPTAVQYPPPNTLSC